MNYLAHVYLADEEDSASIIGNLLADFTNPQNEACFPESVREGIRQHRAIDRFTDQHSVFIRSRDRIDSRFRLLKGVLVDLFYDHFLSKHWEEFHARELSRHCSYVYLMAEPWLPRLPIRMQRMLHFLFAEAGVLEYGSLEGIEAALHGMSGRLSRPNLLHLGTEALVADYEALEADFMEFFPQLIEFSRTYAPACHGRISDAGHHD
ncbi:ACP phosphodiesterase [Coraliomargarita parva]|uniref:acyl carrier protein phosphodiesterase n=1 Tax=Coraliomargarita parva TaxID=3014050 RepID=UPI0022B50832|nr:ACP phosphodiesterase [Coraliomargarita parva]